MLICCASTQLENPAVAPFSPNFKVQFFGMSTWSSVICPCPYLWPDVPLPHHLHSYTQTRDTEPCRGPHTPCCSRCLLLFMPASPTIFIHLPRELHSSFNTVQDASPPEPSLSPQRGMDVLPLNFFHPSSQSHHIVFTRSSFSPDGKGAILHSSSYAQYRTVD